MKRRIWIGTAATIFAWGFVSGLVALSVWQRKPPGRSPAIHRIVKTKGLQEFDSVNPGASEDIRGLFSQGIAAHMRSDFDDAERDYQAVLREIPNEPTTRHNLKVLGNDRKRG